MSTHHHEWEIQTAVPQEVRPGIARIQLHCRKCWRLLDAEFPLHFHEAIEE